MAYRGRYTNTPRDVVGALTEGERADQWGPMPGEIVSYDPASQTATVRPLITKRRYDGSPLVIPDLLEVPVDQPRGQGGAITFPVRAGDRVTLTPAMRSTEGFDTGADGDDDRSFNLSDMRASVTGGDPLTDPMPAVDPDNLHIRAGGSGNLGIRMSPDGRFAIEGAEGNVFALLAEAVRLCAVERVNGIEHDKKGDLLAIADKLDGMSLL